MEQRIRRMAFPTSAHVGAWTADVRPVLYCVDVHAPALAPDSWTALAPAAAPARAPARDAAFFWSTMSSRTRELQLSFPIHPL